MPISLQRALPILDAAGRIGVPVLLKGDSGIGKSSLLTKLAEARGEYLEVVHAALFEASDIGGVPWVHDGTVDLAAMPWVRRVASATGPVCVFFDETNHAEIPTQKALQRVLLEGVAGDTRFPEDTRFVAAMNRVEASTGGWHLPAPIASRFLHLDVEVDPAEWVSGMLTGWASQNTPILCPEPTEAARADALALVTSFITAQPHLLQDQPTDPVLAAGAWPSGRRWDWVARILPYLNNSDRDPVDGLDLVTVAVEGLVGKVAATAFLSYTEELSLPDAADVLADPNKIDWASEPAERVVGILTQVVSHAAVGDADTYARAGAVFAAVIDGGRGDVAAGLFGNYLTNTPEGATRDKKLLAKFAPLLALAGKIG